MGTINASTLAKNPVYHDLELVHAKPSASFVAMADKVGIKWAKTHGGELPMGTTGPYGHYFDYVRSHLASDVKTTGNDARFVDHHPAIAGAVERDFWARSEVQSPVAPPTASVPPLTALPPLPPACVYVPPPCHLPPPPCGAVPEPASSILFGLGLVFLFALMGLRKRPSRAA